MVDRTSIRILSLDGGSLAHTSVQLFVLSEIEQRLGASISSLFDVVAGVGASSFLAAGLVIPDEGDELNSATELTTFYLRNFKKFSPAKKRLGFKNPEHPATSFFKDSLLSEAKVELLLPMLDLQHGQLAEISSWNARSDADQHLDFLVSDLVRSSMSAMSVPEARSIRPLAAVDNSKHLLTSAGQVFSNPTQILHDAVSALCSPETEIQVVSLSCGLSDVGHSLADLRTMEGVVLQDRLQTTCTAVTANQVHTSLAELKSPSTYQRLDYPAEKLKNKPLRKLSLKMLTDVQQDISTQVQTLDLGFLTGQ